MGESLDAPAPDVPAVDDLPHETTPPVAAPAPAAPVVVEVLPDVGPRQVVLRRAPRYRAFIGTGAVAGAVLAVVLTALFPDDGRFSTGSVMGYLAISLALVGGLIGGAVAVVVERPRRR